jgi:hypothetical protein
MAGQNKIKPRAATPEAFSFGYRMFKAAIALRPFAVRQCYSHSMMKSRMITALPLGGAISVFAA